MPSVNGKDIGTFWHKDSPLGLIFRDPKTFGGRLKYLKIDPDNDRITVGRGIFGKDLYHKQNDVVFSKSLENLLGEQLSEKELEYLKIQKNSKTQIQPTEEPRISVDLLGDPVETPNALVQDESSKPTLSRVSSFGSFVQPDRKGANAMTAANTVKDLKRSDTDPKALNLAIESLARSLEDTSLEDRIAIIKHLIVD